jgi:hypothetical protein
MITQTNTVLAAAFIALFVVPAALSPNVARADAPAQPTCPCNDHGQYTTLASEYSPTVCSTVPDVEAPSYYNGVEISASINTPDTSFRADALFFAHNPKSPPVGFCETALGQGNTYDNRYKPSISAPQALSCITDIIIACRDAQP